MKKKDAMNKILKPTFVVGAFMVLLSPNANDYNILLDIINSNEIYGKDCPYLLNTNGLNTNIYSTSGSDETAISLLYAHRNINFTHIHQKFAAVLWKDQWVSPRDARAIHYFGKTKPWNMHVDEYPDLKIWWELADILCIENNKFKQIYYPEYEPNLLDIAVAEYELTKDVQKIIVNNLTNIMVKPNKQEFWRIAKLFTNKLVDMPNKESSGAIIKYSYYTKWNNFLNVEYNYNDFKFITIARIFFNKWINEIKEFVANRIKIKPRKINIEIQKNEILCGNHIKIPKTEEILLKLENNEDISSYFPN
jgi:hypothetical protein